MKRPIIGITCVTEPLERGRAMRHAVDRDYVRAVLAAGGLPVLLTPALDGDAIEALLPTLDGVLFSGGGDVDPRFFGEQPHPKLGRVEPERDRFEVDLARAAWQVELPTLGICRGVQLLNVAAGGKLIQDIPSQIERALHHDSVEPVEDSVHEVALESGSSLRALANRRRVAVNSYHHQAVSDVAPRFRIAAVAADSVVEAIEAVEGPYCVGVQWHPERPTPGTSAPLSKALVESFVEAAAKSKAKRTRRARSSRTAANPSGRR